MASFNTPAEDLEAGDFIYQKSFTVREVQVLEGTGVVVEGIRNGLNKPETHTFRQAEQVWIHRTSGYS